jgi:MFS family permease
MNTTIQADKLFTVSRLALLVTSLSFGIRAGILNNLGTQFHLDTEQLGLITGTAFWGFPLAVITGGFLVDSLGMKNLLRLAGLFHLLGIVLTIFANGFWTLFISTLLIGIANGTVEAACNPLVTTIFPNDKTVKLSHFHLWFPGGIVIGTLISLFATHLGLSWQIQVGVMIIPTLIYLYLASRLAFPPTERVAAGVSTMEMYKSILTPLFIFMIVCMMGTAITELFTGQWIDVLLHNVTQNAILILTLTAGVQTLGRAFAEPVVHKLSPVGVLFISVVLSALGLYLMAHTGGYMIFFSALLFGMGVTFFWPTMLGFVSENIPKSGALGINLMGGAGMFAVSVYLFFMGGVYDRILARHLPAGAVLSNYQAAAPNSPEADLLIKAKSFAGPEILMQTMIIPLVLIFAFGGLYFYMRGREKPSLITNAA